MADEAIAVTMHLERVHSAWYNELVVPGLVPATSIRRERYLPDRGGRDKPGHDP